MPILAIILAIQVFCIVDVIRRGRNSIWIMALVFLPMASAIAYFIVEVLPRLQGNRHVRAARQQIVEKIDPERELRAAQQALDVADTVANRMRVADALTELGRHKEALRLYRKAIGPKLDVRTAEKLARSLYLNDRPDEALATLETMPGPATQADRDRMGLLRARILEDLDRNDEALVLYADISERLPGDEARCRYAALLLKVGKKGPAMLVLEEVERRARHLDRFNRSGSAEMYDWAARELAVLRG
jgi:hypothetical protein